MSSIPPNSPWRGCAAFFPQPVSENDMLAAQHLAEAVYDYNCRLEAGPRLPDIEYRNSSREADILHHVFRWDSTHYEVVFQNGFQARPQDHTPDDVYFHLEHHINHGGMPLDPERFTTDAFVSTTISSTWRPPPNKNITEVYRYEIYAPGGIWVTETLGDYYVHPAQDEVCFVAGIATQYIRSAQRFRLNNASRRYPTWERADTVLIENGNFNPQSHPLTELNIQLPVSYYYGANRTRVPLTISIWNPPLASRRQKRQVSTESDTINWYARNVVNSESYVNAAFRSSCTNEAYLFMQNEYVLLDYAPGTTDDKVLNGPLLICDGYPSLADTAFAEYGIDCSFGSHDLDEAFIFFGNHCAQINYAPGTTNDKIIKGPMSIIAMFPFFKGTVFESGLDAAFESSTRYEAYLFKDNHYALINYSSNSHLIASRDITQGFASLKNTIFESGIDAAFASHKDNEAYLFKGDSYALINFAPGTTNDYVIGGVKNILPNWPSLRSILPRKNQGLDFHDHAKPDPDRDHDEL